MSTIEEWDSDAPGWEGSETKKIELLMSDGSIKRGTFEMEDSVFDGESSYPIWYVEFEDGTERRSFYDNSIKGWREIK